MSPDEPGNEEDHGRETLSKRYRGSRVDFLNIFSTAQNRCRQPRHFHTTPRRSATGRDIERQTLFYCPRFPVSTARRLDPPLSATAPLNQSDRSREKTGKRSSVSISDRARLWELGKVHGR